ncbi:MAG: hypothetical protein EZS28_045324, partial [Streblomastix strix]
RTVIHVGQSSIVHAAEDRIRKARDRFETQLLGPSGVYAQRKKNGLYGNVLKQKKNRSSSDNGEQSDNGDMSSDDKDKDKNGENRITYRAVEDGNDLPVDDDLDSKKNDSRKKKSKSHQDRLAELPLAKLFHGPTTNRHHGDIFGIAFHPPSMMVTTSSDGTVVVWNADSGFPKSSFKGAGVRLGSPSDNDEEDIQREAVAKAAAQQSVKIVRRSSGKKLDSKSDNENSDGNEDNEKANKDEKDNENNKDSHDDKDKDSQNDKDKNQDSKSNDNQKDKGTRDQLQSSDSDGQSSNNQPSQSPQSGVTHQQGTAPKTVPPPQPQDMRSITSCYFIPDRPGYELLTFGVDGHLRFWDVINAKCFSDVYTGLEGGGHILLWSCSQANDLLASQLDSEEDDILNFALTKSQQKITNQGSPTQQPEKPSKNSSSKNKKDDNIDTELAGIGQSLILIVCGHNGDTMVFDANELI